MLKIIREQELYELIYDSIKLSCLERNGVSDWEEYDTALEELEEEIKDRELTDLYPDYEYDVIGWPAIQFYMGLKGFKENSTLIEPSNSLGIRSSTYLVSKKWIDSISNENTENLKRNA